MPSRFTAGPPGPERPSRIFRRLAGRILKRTAVLLLLAAGGYLAFGRFAGREPPDAPQSQTSPPPVSDAASRAKELGKTEIRELLRDLPLFNIPEKSFLVPAGGKRVRVETTLDTDFQTSVLRKLNRSHARHIGIVVMEPSTGKVLAMIGFDRNDPSGNPCIDSRFPAASIFKIVTAAAALEKCGFTPDSSLFYTGGKHTLYKNQLSLRTGKYGQEITLKTAFAQSINPVFGKIGIHHVGPAALERYASTFGFNRPIGLEVPVSPSLFSLSDSDDAYRIAEAASGFNRTTTLSPLHGALLVSAILNRGKLIEPTVVERVLDENGEVLYRNGAPAARQAISPETAAAMHPLLEATVRSGTARKGFSGYGRDTVLSRLNLGGKTGSINSHDPDARNDWFVGFAEEKNGSSRIAVAVVVTHEKFIGIKSVEYARMLIKEYFRIHFAGKGKKV